MIMADEKPKLEETEESYQFFYEGFSQLVPKSVIKSKKKAQEFADESHKEWLKSQPPATES
jgi:hypothetical protein